jgi:vitamin B12 transporter
MRGERVLTLVYSEGFRAPSLSELYLLHTSSYGLTMQGNPYLLPEKVQAIEIIHENLQSDYWHWSISLFHNRYENMIDFVYTVPVLAINREGVTGNGIEYKFQFGVIDAISFSGSCAYLNMSDRGGDPILYRSKHRGQLYINYKNKLIKIRVGVQAWSKQNYEDFLSHHYQLVDEKIIFPFRELPERVIPELILSKEMGTYTASLRISNVFDTQYELIQDYPMPGRTWNFTLTKTIKKE